jgi:hypothetical protein
MASIGQLSAFRSSATINQIGGSGDKATVTQKDTFNDANILQSGLNQTATVNQSGFGTAMAHNSAMITQSGAGHVATATQSGGSGNKIKIVQN